MLHIYFIKRKVSASVHVFAPHVKTRASATTLRKQLSWYHYHWISALNFHYVNVSFSCVGWARLSADQTEDQSTLTSQELFQESFILNLVPPESLPETTMELSNQAPSSHQAPPAHQATPTHRTPSSHRAPPTHRAPSSQAPAAQTLHHVLCKRTKKKQGVKQYGLF